jgi:tetratricopeptide (TPR) repeat protein
VAGCATVAEVPTAKIAAPDEALVALRRERAAAFEQKGEIRNALNEWKIALTIAPQDPVSLAGKKRVEALVAQALNDSLSRGREALKHGAPLEARRQFLMALAVDPANQAAFDALQNEIRETRIVQHTVRRGETLASIAEYYYADRSRAEVIWELNELPANPKIAPGMILRIPEIPGVQFRPEGPRVASPSPEAAKPDTSESVDLDYNPLLDEARAALGKKEFAVALAGIDKFLGQNPRNIEALELKKTLLYEQGKVLFEQKKFAEAYAAFDSLNTLAPNHQDAAALLGRARTQLVQQHYSQGLRFYREEKLQAAIGEWRQVLQFDSNHQAAKKNIEQAERLLKGLQQRQQRK